MFLDNESSFWFYESVSIIYVLFYVTLLTEGEAANVKQ